MKRILNVIILLVMSLCAMAKGFSMPEYDITGAGSGSAGTVLVKVFVYAKSATDAELKCAATHGVVFRGCSGNMSGAMQPAMASPTAETDNAEFCKAFFTPEGMCQNFASVIAGSYERVKTKKGYKTGAIIQINKKALRQELEKAGVVRSLSSGF